MRAIHKTYGPCLVSREDWDKPTPMITAVFKTPIYLPRQGYKSILTVGKGALSGQFPSKGYTKPHRIKTVAEQYLPFARGIARSMKTDYDDWYDIEAAAFTGLIKAAEKYDEARGITFVAFADPWIRGEIKMHWREKSKSDDEEAGSDLFWEQLMDTDPDMAQKEMLQNIREVLPKLSSRKRALIERRYLDDNPATWAELASDFNISKQRLHKLKSEAFEALRNELL